MVATASQASLVILQSSVRGLSEAIWRAPPSVDLEAIGNGGENLSVLKMATAMNVESVIICIFSLVMVFLMVLEKNVSLPFDRMSGGIEKEMELGVF